MGIVGRFNAALRYWQSRLRGGNTLVRLAALRNNASQIKTHLEDAPMSMGE
ncbi:MAG: hypothetical protein O9266_09695 [Porphyrobacter sp.]|jgi:hypothetical protein|nr:hypothetical protein [Porphyrobacter sp.]